MKKFALSFLLLWSCTSGPDPSVPVTPVYDYIIRNGTIYDGSGSEGYVADVAISGDRVTEIGHNLPGRGKKEVDASGMAVTPGYINMLSWATESLIIDGRSQSDIRQGVTLEVFGEGGSGGPLSEAMKAEYDTPPEWTTLGAVSYTHLTLPTSDLV